MRPRQWVKNSLLFAVLVFGGELSNINSLVDVVLGVILFSLFASVVYIFNDIVDRESDRLHPNKKFRPIASGALSTKNATIAGVILLIVITISAYFLSPIFLSFCMLYLFLNLIYTYIFKHIVVLDVLMLASFYVIRLYAGASLANVEYISPWLVMTTTFLALFMALGKRRAELTQSTETPKGQRKVLESYSKKLLEQLITITLTLTILTYSLYTFSAPNLPESNIMMLTIPFVIFGIFRYLYLIQVKDKGETPEEIILTDLPLKIGILLWSLTIFGIFYL